MTILFLLAESAEKQKLTNVLYSVLLAMPLVDADVNDELGSQLYSLSRTGVLDLSAVLVSHPLY